MIIKSIPFFYIKIFINDYLKYKDKLLKLINQANINNTLKESKTDFNLDQSNHEYKYIFYSMIKSAMLDIKKELSFNDYIVKIITNNIWFAQYNKNNYHNWHTHSNTNFSNIFYLENETNITTTFYDFINKKEYNIKTKEGDLLMFPGYIIHKSNINKTDKRKTVIVFNSNIEKE